MRFLTLDTYGRKSRPAKLYCNKCAIKLNLQNPVGIIVFNQYSYVNEDNTHFHLVTDYKTGVITTLCGLPHNFDSQIGTHGLVLTEDELGHDWLRHKKPCKECFKNVL